MTFCAKGVLMIRSMTGFGKAIYHDSIEINMEIRSLNAKGCDMNIRLPKRLFAMEDQIRNHLKQELSRGKIDVFIHVREPETHVTYVANHAVISAYYQVLSEIAATYDGTNDISLSQLIQVDGAVEAVEQDSEDDIYRAPIQAALEMALLQLQAMRETEGHKLAQDLDCKLDEMSRYVQQLQQLRQKFMPTYADQLRSSVKQLLPEDLQAVDEQRLVTEVAYYVEKSDIEEELVRLTSHIAQFKQILNGEQQVVGRRLDFIAQEMLRETNTIGSKSIDISISNIVISLKTIIDQIKEQVQNIL